jgi:hypothetical protein
MKIRMALSIVALLVWLVSPVFRSGNDVDSAAGALVVAITALTGIYLGVESLVSPVTSVLYRFNKWLSPNLTTTPFRLGAPLFIVVNLIIAWTSVRRLFGF